MATHRWAACSHKGEGNGDGTWESVALGARARVNLWFMFFWLRQGSSCWFNLPDASTQKEGLRAPVSSGRRRDALDFSIHGKPTFPTAGSKANHRAII